MEINYNSILSANKIELHYQFFDNSHSMNAFVQNRCEYEFLGMLKEIATVLNAEIIIETEPLAEGGLIRIFKLVYKNESKKVIITTALLTSLATAIFVTPVATSIGKATEVIIGKLFEDEELKQLEKDKLKLEIEDIKLDLELKRQKLEESQVIIKKRSNFFESLEKYNKVTEVSVSVSNENNIEFDKRYVQKENFKNYILKSNDLEPLDVEDAVIEIISPVLKKGKFKWKGIYNGEVYSFNMKSNEFKTLVQTGEIEFKNGTSIKCFLEIKRSINNEGEIEINELNIIRVDEWFENNQPVETPEGKHHKQKKDAEKRQYRLDDDDLF